MTVRIAMARAACLLPLVSKEISQIVSHGEIVQDIEVVGHGEIVRHVEVFLLTTLVTDIFYLLDLLSQHTVM